MEIVREFVRGNRVWHIVQYFTFTYIHQHQAPGAGGLSKLEEVLKLSIAVTNPTKER